MIRGRPWAPVDSDQDRGFMLYSLLFCIEVIVHCMLSYCLPSTLGQSSVGGGNEDTWEVLTIFSSLFHLLLL